MFDKLLDKLRELFSEKYRDFKTYLKEDAPEIAEKAIDFAAEKYTECDGDTKMQYAIEFVLENLHIPAIYAVIASKVILAAVKSFIQDKYDELKNK